MAESYSVEAFLRADNTGFMRSFQAAADTAQQFERDINNMNVSGIQNVGQQFEEVGERISNAGQNIQDFGGNMTKYVTVPLVAAGALALNSAMDHETAFAKMRAQLGLTGKESGNYEKIATDMWKNAFGENIGDVTQAISTVKTNIQELDEADLQKVTEGAFVLQDVFDKDINETTALASVLMKNFETDATTAFDLLTVGIQKGGDYSDELLDTMKEYAPIFSTMGFSAEDMMNLLISGAQAGAFNLDKVGDSMKEFNIRAKDGSDTTAEGFEAIGLNAEEMGNAIAAGGDKGEQAFMATIAALAAMEDPVARNAAGVSLFGATWEDLEADVITSMTSSVDHVGKFEGATQKAGDTMYDTFGSRMTTLFRTMGEALLPVGNILLDFAERWLPPILEKIQSLSTWFGNLSDKSQLGVVAFGAIAAALGPIIVGFGFLVSTVGSVVTMFGGLLTRFAPVIARTAILRTGVSLMGRAFAMLLGPVGIAIAVLMTLIPVFVNLYKENETFRNVVLSVWESIKTAISSAIAALAPVFESFKNTFATLKPVIEGLAMIIGGVLVVAFGIVLATFSAAMAAIGPLISAFLSLVDTVVNVALAIGAVLTGDFSAALKYWNLAVESSISFFKSLWDGVVGYVSTLVSTIIDYFYNLYIVLVGNSIIPDMVEAIIKWFQNLGTKSMQLVSSLVSGVIRFFTNLWTATVAATQALVAGIKAKWAELKADVIAKAAQLYQSAKQKFDQLKTAISTAIQLAKTAVSTKFSEMLTAARTKAQEILSAIRAKFQEVVSAIREKLAEAVRTVGTFIGQMPGKVREGISQMVTAGASLVGGVISGIKSKISEGLGVIGGLATSLISRFKKDTDTHSPSRAFEDISKWFVPGIVRGIDKTSGQAFKTIADLSAGITNAFNPELAMSSTDYNAQVNSLNGQISRDMNASVSSELTISKQPAQVNLMLGGRNFTAFVDDISSEQALVSRLERGR